MKRDWDALKIEFINRCLQPGGKVSLRDFGREKGIPQTTLDRNTKGWADEAEARSAQVADQAMDEVLLDHVKIRKEILKSGFKVSQLVDEELELFAKTRSQVKCEDRAPLDIQDLRRLQQMQTELLIVGGGLPKEHVVHVDDSHDEIVWNREQQRRAAQAAQKIRAHGIKTGRLALLKGGKDAEAQDGELDT